MNTSVTIPAPNKPTRRTEPYWRDRVDGLHIVKLSGTYYEMGRQHGELLRDEVRRG